MSKGAKGARNTGIKQARQERHSPVGWIGHQMVSTSRVA